MAIDTISPRTRRSLLGAALGAAAATVATAIRPIEVHAAGDDGATVAVGGNYLDVRSQTTLINKNSDWSDRATTGRASTA